MTIEAIQNKMAEAIDEQKRYVLANKAGDVFTTNSMRWLDHGAIILYTNDTPYTIDSVERAFKKYLQVVKLINNVA